MDKSKTFEAWLKAKGIDPKDLSPSHLDLWRAEYDRLPKPAKDKPSEGVNDGSA